MVDHKPMQNKASEDRWVMCPFKFAGNPDEDVISFLEDFIPFCNMEKLTHSEMAQTLRMALSGRALTWLKSLGPLAQSKDLLPMFKSRFQSSNQIYNIIYVLSGMRLQEGESPIELLDRMKAVAVRISLSDDILVPLALRALPTNITDFVVISANDFIISWAYLYTKCKFLEEYLNKRATTVDISLPASVPAAASPNSPPPDSLTCFFCRHNGHTVENCKLAESAKKMMSIEQDEKSLEKSLAQPVDASAYKQEHNEQTMNYSPASNDMEFNNNNTLGY